MITASLAFIWNSCSLMSQKVCDASIKDGHKRTSGLSLWVFTASMLRKTDSTLQPETQNRHEVSWQTRSPWQQCDGQTHHRQPVWVSGQCGGDTWGKAAPLRQKTPVYISNPVCVCVTEGVSHRSSCPGSRPADTSWRPDDRWRGRSPASPAPWWPAPGGGPGPRTTETPHSWLS